MIEHFIERYITAFLKQDTNTIVDIYSYPVTFYAESGEAMTLDKEQFSENTRKLFKIYEKIGVANIGHEILNKSKLSECLTLVSVKWSFQDNARAEIYHCTTRYLYRFSAGRIEIPAVFVVDEITNFNRLKSEGKI